VAFIGTDAVEINNTFQQGLICLAQLSVRPLGWTKRPEYLETSIVIEKARISADAISKSPVPWPTSSIAIRGVIQNLKNE